MWGLAHLGWKLNDYSQTLIQTLRRSGYTTALAGIQHIARGDPQEAAKLIGYDTLPKISNPYSVVPVANAAVDYLGRPPTQPFLLDVGFVATHALPKTPTGSYFGYENGDLIRAEIPVNLGDVPQTRRDMADFGVAASKLDEAIGRVLGALERSGLADNTLVMITTDHGIPFPGMKANHTDGGLEVMLMLRGPGGFSGGRVSNALVSQIDIFPTFCELLELPKPAWLEGKSLMPLVRGEVEEINKAVFAEHEAHAVPEPQASVRTKRYKYIRRLDGSDQPRPANTDLTYTKELWVKEDWFGPLAVPEQLYDLRADPLENNNLAADPKHQETLSEMRRLMVARMNRYNNPLLQKYHVADAPPEKRALAVTPQLTPQMNSSSSELGVIYTGETQ